MGFQADSEHGPGSGRKRKFLSFYVLLGKAGIFNPECNVGVFNESNGFFENEDEGTGAGVFTSQICGWRTNDNRDIIGINGFYNDHGGSFSTIIGNLPKFYLFENNSFTELTNTFPDVKANLFFDCDTCSIEGIPTYYTFPKDSGNVRFNLGLPLDYLRKDYDTYKEICDKYSNIKRISIDIAFDPIIGSFHVSN